MASRIVQLRSIPLWEPRWGEVQLKKRYKEGKVEFERGFRMRAASDDDLTFPSFKLNEIRGLVLGEIQRNNWPSFTGVDLAGSKRPGNAIVTVKVDPNSRRRYPVDVRYGAWKSFETARQIQDVNALYSPVVIMVENNGYQQALLDWISDSKDRFPFWMKLEPTTTTDGFKSDLSLGLPGLEVEFQNQAWCFPLGEYENATIDDPDPRRAAWARLAYECSRHPIASTSDGLMALWMARQGIELHSGYVFAGSDVGSISSR